MKKFYASLVTIILLAVWCATGFETSAQKSSDAANLVSPNLVISQFQVAGGTANDEFIELHNIGSNAVDLNGHRLVYRSASGTNDVLFIEWTTSVIVPAGGYYLIASTNYDGAVTPNITYNPTTCSCSMSATGGGLAIRQGASNTGLIIDSVGYGSATNIFIETAATTPAAPANDSKVRAQNGCTDTDNNANDFSILTPAAPRNAANAPVACATGGTTLFASLSANPTTVTPGGTTLLTVTIIPATNPPSTGFIVTGNLSSIGGINGQAFFDDGTNGDQTAGDNIYSYLATVAAGTTGGTKNITANVSDSQGRSASPNVNINVNAPLPGDNPLLLGNPSGATTDIANENNYLMIKPQYTLSYNRSKATPNWVAWRLDSSWLGAAQRQDDFRPDPDLPTGWYRVTDSDYSNSGYTRGHMTPSGDRTRSIPDNSATFLMTNMVPQISENNSGPWEEFETYCRTLAQQGNELYIISGGVGSLGTIAQGRIVVPQYTWKVVLIIPNGDDDLARVNKQTRTIGLVVPNFTPLNINAPWRQFRVTVDAVENITGHNFYSNVPKNTQEIIERRRDLQ